MHREHNDAGEYSILWNGIDLYGKDLPSGLYIVQMTSEKYNQTQKILF